MITTSGLALQLREILRDLTLTLERGPLERVLREASVYSQLPGEPRTGLPIVSVSYTEPDERGRAFERAGNWANLTGSPVEVRHGDHESGVLCGFVYPGQRAENAD